MARQTHMHVARVLLASEAAVAIRSAIFDGRLVQGERVNEVRLSETLGISRGPLREALRRLEQDGLVTSVPHRGASIVRVTPEDVMDVLSIRSVLEPYAVDAAITREHHALVEAITAASGEMREAAAARDRVRMSAAHGRFHAAFYAWSGNRMLAGIWSRLEDPIRLYLLRRESTFGDMSHVAGAHDRLLTLVRDGDSTGAQGEVVAHLSTNIRAVSHLLLAGADGGGSLPISSEFADEM